MIVRIVIDMGTVERNDGDWKAKLLEYIESSLKRMDDDVESRHIRDEREQVVGKITRTDK